MGHLKEDRAIAFIQVDKKYHREILSLWPDIKVYGGEGANIVTIVCIDNKRWSAILPEYW